MHTRIRLAATATVALAALASAIAGTASGATTQAFQATFHDVSFQNTCSPPIVFCGNGTVDGYGRATTMVRVTRNLPITGTSCNDVAGIRTITLDSGSGSFVSTFTGQRCPLGDGGAGFRVDFDWTADPNASSGVFAGATGSGTGVNTTAGNVQVVSLTGTITT
jgi:hypothetical protein